MAYISTGVQALTCVWYDVEGMVAGPLLSRHTHDQLEFPLQKTLTQKLPVVCLHIPDNLTSGCLPALCNFNLLCSSLLLSHGLSSQLSTAAVKTATQALYDTAAPARLLLLLLVLPLWAQHL